MEIEDVTKKRKKPPIKNRTLWLQVKKLLALWLHCHTICRRSLMAPLRDVDRMRCSFQRDPTQLLCYQTVFELVWEPGCWLVCFAHPLNDEWPHLKKNQTFDGQHRRLIVIWITGIIRTISCLGVLLNSVWDQLGKDCSCLTFWIVC